MPSALIRIPASVSSMGFTGGIPAAVISRFFSLLHIKLRQYRSSSPAAVQILLDIKENSALMFFIRPDDIQVCL
jgi:hypothetical protein